MKRRAFLKYMSQSALVSLGGFALTRAAAGQEFCSDFERGHDEESLGCYLESDGLKTYGYYQGLGPSERRSSSRSDGTYYKMPCIPQEDIEFGEDRVYEFWHGHNGRVHQFTVTTDDFALLREGREVEVYTDVVTGHRHALLISPQKPCD